MLLRKKEERDAARGRDRAESGTLVDEDREREQLDWT